MKKISLILFVFFLKSFSQNLNIEYSISKINDKEKTNVIYNLVIENQKSIFYPHSKCVNLNNEENLIPQITSEIIVEKNEKIKIFDKIGKLGVFYIPKDIKKLDWHITGDTKIENGYKLKKANLDYKNKEWEAWYIEEIPINEGPYIFKNLPGLIYSVTNQNKSFTFELLSIKKEIKNCNLNLNSYKEINEEKYKTTLETSENANNKLLENLMNLDIPKDNFKSLNNKIGENNILRNL